MEQPWRAEMSLHDAGVPDNPSPENDFHAQASAKGRLDNA
jgi:hypothetical protein